MNLENPLRPDPGAAPSVESIKQGLESLRILFAMVLAILVLLAASLDLFLFKQQSTVRKQVEESRVTVKAMVEDFNKNKAPVMGAFVNSLYSFAQTDSNFVTILKKYPIQTATQPAAKK